MRPEKVALVDTWAEKLKDAKGVYVADYSGMTVAAMTELRGRCRASSIEFKVIKNTLARRALREELREPMDHLLTGPTALAISLVDEITPAKVLADFAREFQLPRIKGGLIGGRVYGAEDVKTLAGLPSKDVLLAQFIGGLKSPIQKLHSALSSPLRHLATVLKAVADKAPAA